MTRKDYRAFAQALGECYAKTGQPLERAAIGRVVDALVDVLIRDKSTFDETRFRNAILKAENQHLDPAIEATDEQAGNYVRFEEQEHDEGSLPPSEKVADDDLAATS